MPFPRLPLPIRSLPSFTHAFLLVAIAVAALSVPSIAEAATKTWDGGGGDANCSTAANWSGDAIPLEGDDIVFDGATSTKSYTWDSACPSTIGSLTQEDDYTGTGTIATTYSGGFQTLTITGNLTLLKGGWSHQTNTTAETNRLKADVGGDLVVGTGATINVDRLGYNAGQGPGGNGLTGSHGGKGGRSVTETAPQSTYGSITAPENLGSGGGTGKGGGAIKITVIGGLTVNGVISSRADYSSWGDGAGGSVFLTANDISGNGTIRANGGEASPERGGGGGRVSVILTGAAEDFSGFSGSITAYGADGTTGSGDGAAGTVYKQTGSQESGEGELIISNFATASTRIDVTTTIPADTTWIVHNLTLKNRGILEVGSGSTLDLHDQSPASDSDNTDGIRLNRGTFTINSPLTIEDWSLVVDGEHSITGNIIVADGGNITHSDNSTFETYKMNLTVTGDFDLQEGGTVNVDGLGYNGGQGPGKANAGAYGGKGGIQSSSEIPGPTYGSVTAPTNLGSGGDTNSGGGAIQLTVLGSSTINGTISARGSGTNYGGGAGGSIYFTTVTLSGGGVIRANGDAGPATNRGGGGGRVAVIVTGPDADFTSYSGSVTAYGGDVVAAGQDGAAGTVYMQTQTQGNGGGTLIIDKNNLSTASTVITDLNGQTAAGITVGALSLQNAAVFLIGGDDSLTLTSRDVPLDIRSGTTFVNGGTLTLSGTGTSIAGTYTSSGSNTVHFTGQSDDATVTIPNLTYVNVTVNNPGTVFTPEAALSATTLVVSGGTLDLRGNNATVSSTFRVVDGATLALNGDETVSAPTFDAGSTVIYQGTGTYNSLSVGDTYQHLSFSGSGVWNIDAAVAVAGQLAFSGGTLNANGNTIDVTGLTILDGGTYQASTAQQTLSGGLLVSGGTFTGSTGPVSLSGSLTLSAGTLTAPSGTLTIAGDWTKTGGTFASNGGSVVFAGSATQSLRSGGTDDDSDFSTLRIQKSGGTVSLATDAFSGALLQISGGTFTPGSLAVTAGALTIDGGTFTGAAGTLDINGNVSLTSGAFTAPSTTASIVGDWTVSGGTFTGNGGTVSFDGAGLQTIASGGQALAGLTINKSAGTLTLATNDLTVGGAFMLTSGTFAQGLVHLTVTGNMTLASGTTFTRSPDAAKKLILAGDLTLTDNTASKQNLGYLQIGTSPDTTDLATDITAWKIDVGTGDILNTHGFDLAIGTGGLTLFGTLDATDDVAGDDTAISLSGDWTMKPTGAFTHGTGSVTLNGAHQTLSGSTTFYNLTKSVLSPATLTFAATTTQTVANTLTLTGVGGNPLALRSSQNGSHAFLTVLAGTSPFLQYLDVRDSNASNGQTLVCDTTLGCVNAGGNINWSFPAPTGDGGPSIWLLNLRRENNLTLGGQPTGGSGGGSTSSGGITSFTPDYAPLAQAMKDAQERARKTVDPATLDPRRIPAIREALIARFNQQMSGGDRREAELEEEEDEQVTVRGTSLSRIAQRRGLLSAIVDGEEVLYRDVDIYAWYAPYVSLLIEENVAQGYKDARGKPTGVFGTANPVTREEVLKMALEAAQTDLTGEGSPRNRTAQGRWSSAYVVVAEALELSVFRPSANVQETATRGEVIQTILEVMGITIGTTVRLPYSDVLLDHPHALAIDAATYFGIVEGDRDKNGNPTNTFRPDDSINRAEAAKIIALIQELMRR